MYIINPKYAWEMKTDEGNQRISTVYGDKMSLIRRVKVWNESWGENGRRRCENENDELQCGEINHASYSSQWDELAAQNVR